MDHLMSQSISTFQGPSWSQQILYKRRDFNISKGFIEKANRCFRRFPICLACIEKSLAAFSLPNFSSPIIFKCGKKRLITPNLVRVWLWRFWHIEYIYYRPSNSRINFGIRGLIFQVKAINFTHWKPPSALSYLQFFLQIVMKRDSNIYCPKISDEFYYEGTPSLNMCTVEHLMSPSILAFLCLFIKVIKLSAN